TNTYTGQTNINAGIVQLASLGNVAASAGPNTLGAVTGSVVVAAGATLQLNPGAATTYVSKQLILNGPGLGLTNSGLLLATGALQNIANVANTWAGNIILNTADATVSSTQGTLTLAGTVSGTGGLTKVGAGTVVLAATDTYT